MDELPTILPASRLEEILGSDSRLRVARLLVELPDKEFTGREMARNLGLSHSTVLQALRVLTNQGLATERVLGRAHIFRANRSHFLYHTLATLFQSERDQRQRIREIIRGSLASSSVSVTLFGSRARGNAGERSDVDLVVVSQHVDQAEAALSSLGDQLRRNYGLRLDAKVLTPDQVKARIGAPFVKAAVAEGILIAGKPLEKVIGSAA